jgi:diguanylate cyclase (GGDEF)-like protein/PAS domain S-box-containing protein
MNKLINKVEQDRLEALQKYNILDTEPDADFDDLVKLAVKIFNVPISTITIVDENRQWFKSAVGLDIKETSRDISFCTHAIASKQPLIVKDATKDDRFSNNPLVLKKPNVMFYAGVPLLDSESNALGTLCIIGHHQRDFSDDELETLKILANQAMRLLDLRAERNKLHLLVSEIEKINTELSISEQRWKFALEGSGDGVWDWNIKTGVIFRSKQFNEMLGYAENEIGNDFKAWVSLIHDDDVDLVLKSLNKYLNNETEIYAIEHRLLCKDNSWKWILSRGMIVEYDENESPLRMVGTHTDITDRKKSEELIWTQANFDILTGLPNRRMFFYRLTEEIKRSLRLQSKFALMFLDLDGFKKINDQYGHQAGDDVLVESARRIRSNIRESDTFARLGGDEFTIIMNLQDDIHAYEKVAENIIDAFNPAFLKVDTSCRVSVSIGIAIFPINGDTANMLLSEADKAMYKAKSLGKNGWYQTPVD